MTKQETIEWFEFMKEKFENTKYEDALNMAIEALQQEPCKDCMWFQQGILRGQRGYTYERKTDK